MLMVAYFLLSASASFFWAKAGVDALAYFFTDPLFLVELVPLISSVCISAFDSGLVSFVALPLFWWGSVWSISVPLVFTYDPFFLSPTDASWPTGLAIPPGGIGLPVAVIAGEGSMLSEVEFLVECGRGLIYGIWS